MGRTTRQNERGFALLLVIWLVALLALLAVVVAADSRSGAEIVHNQIERAQARMDADSGITLALANLLSPDASDRWSADDMSHTVDYAGGTVTIAIADEGGKIDLNQAPLDLIAGLFDELGVNSKEQAVLTDAIKQRRQAFARAYPPPSRIYAAARDSVHDLARLAFADPSELRLIPGMTAALYRRVLPYVTVYSGSPTVNPLTAPRAVLLAIPGIRPAEVDALIAKRSQASGQTDLSGLMSVARYARVTESPAVTITAQAVLPGGASFTRQAVAALYRNRGLQAARILGWRQPAPGSTR